MALNVVGLRKYLNACPGVDHSLSHGQTEKLLHAAMVELGMIEDKPQKAQHKTGHPGKGGQRGDKHGGKQGNKPGNSPKKSGKRNRAARRINSPLLFLVDGDLLSGSLNAIRLWVSIMYPAMQPLGRGLQPASKTLSQAECPQ